MQRSLLLLGFSTALLACALEGAELGPIDETASAEHVLIYESYAHELDAEAAVIDAETDDIGILACENYPYYYGAGSCSNVCGRYPEHDYKCTSGVRWKCEVVNYEHSAKYQGHPGQYRVTGGPWTYYFCAHQNPANCPSFCN